MNKQTIIGFIVIGVILFGFSWYQNGQQKKANEAAAEMAQIQRTKDSIARANAPEPVAPEFDSTVFATGTETPSGEAAATQANSDPLGATLAAARGGEERTFSVENDVMTIEFSTRGGIVSDVVLKEYTTYGGEALHMWKPSSEVFDVSLFLRAGGRDAQLNTREFNFAAELIDTEWQAGEEFKRVAMRLPVGGTGSEVSDGDGSVSGSDPSSSPDGYLSGDGARAAQSYIEFVYIIPRDDYMIGYEVNFVGMEDLMSNQSSFTIDWANTSLQNEKGFDNENNYTTLAYRYPDVKSIEQLGIGRPGDLKEKSETSRVKWVAFKQHFFSSILIAEDAFQGVDMECGTYRPGEGAIKDFKAGFTVPMEREKDTYNFRMYFGPNKFSGLKKYDLSMERIISIGWMSFGWVSRTFLIPLFEWLSSGGMGIGWVILLMTFIVKLVISPLTFTSYLSSAKMRVIKPEVDEINAKYPDQADAMKKQQATMELYRKAGINPLAGCIPMLIQFPIIIAMFRFFPSAIELRQKPLWWAEDLSSYDSILDLGFNIPWYGNHVSLFALLMAVSMFFYSWLNFKQQAAQPQMAGMKFMMLYAMPIFTLLFLNNFSSGLCYYYLLGNLFTMAQMYGVRMFINEDKLRRKMLETPRKEKKKSGFMQRLEEAQKAQLAAARGQQQQSSRGGGQGGRQGGGPKKK